MFAVRPAETDAQELAEMTDERLVSEGHLQRALEQLQQRGLVRGAAGDQLAQQLAPLRVAQLAEGLGSSARLGGVAVQRRAHRLAAVGGLAGQQPEPGVDADWVVLVTERSEFFEREVQRLRADLRQAEQSIVALESGLRDFHSRADAVSALAEARIALERVSRSVPWRADRVREARGKLREASRQLEAGHVGAAVFFASRAQRITQSLRAEARQVSLWSERRTIRAEKVHLRAGPSTSHRVLEVLLQETPVFPERSAEGWTLVRTPDGRVGWIHASLLAGR